LVRKFKARKRAGYYTVAGQVGTGGKQILYNALMAT